MSFIDDISFSSNLSIDKIVRVFTGKYDIPGTCIIRNYTYAGSPSPQYLYVIPHGLPRPVLCDAQFSTDGITWIDGGLSNLAGLSMNAFSDTTNIYLISPYTTAISGLYYRVFCRWIDNYDTTDPSIQTQSYNNQPLQLDSRANFLKIAKSGVLTFSPGVFGASETLSVPHGLDMSPRAKVWYEEFDGEIWNPTTGGTGDPYNISDTQDNCLVSITDTLLSIQAIKFSNRNTRAWYRIYYDQS